MPNAALTPEKVRNYQENGFVVLENFLSADELEFWRRSVDEAVANRTGATPAQLAGNKLFDRKEGAAAPGDSGVKKPYYASVFTQSLQLHMDHEGVNSMMLDPDIGKAAATLAGVQGIRIWHDQALIKEPWANPTGWHLDNPYWSFGNEHGPHGGAISLWVALDDATPENGALLFIPGSHKEAEYHRNAGIGENLGELFEVYPEWAAREPVMVPMKAGTASFHSGMTAHGAGANMTSGRRRAMTCGYMPDGATFNGNPNVLPPDYLETINVGDVLDSDELNPLLWRSTGADTAPKL